MISGLSTLPRHRQSLMSFLIVTAAFIALLPAIAMGADFPDVIPPGALSRAATVPSGDAPAFAGRVDPDTYIIGPGDEFAFRASDLADPKILRVGPAGELLLPDVGAMPVAGLTLREFDTRAREALRPYVRGKGLVLVLNRPRRFRAVVVGEVERPGAVLVQAPVRASDVIEAAGGVNGRGARRGIVVRRGTDSLFVDLVRYERTGAEDANPLVFETDVVVVPVSSRRALVGGAVGRPGEYDVIAGDRASTLLAAAGGLLPRAAGDRATLSREDAPGHRSEMPVRFGADDPLVQAGDQIFVPERAHWNDGSSVQVYGEVALPGPYSVADGGDTVGQLVERAGGFTEWADRSAVRVERRSEAAVRDSAFLRLARDESGLVPTGERDYIVAVSRERNALSPGNVGGRDGGWTAFSALPLLDGDHVIVPRRSLTVMVQGEVKAPGHVAYTPGRSVSDYVRAAGGYTGRANKGRARVTLAATGRPVNASDIETLQAGDIVWVPSKEPRSTWGAIRDVLTVASQIATVYLVVREATK